MSLVLPSTVEELNFLQNSMEFQSVQPMYVKDSSKDFDNIQAGRYKREFSLPNGVQWDVHDFEPYLNFSDIPLNNYEVIKSHEDRLVPGDEQRQRSESFSSVSSSIDDKSMAYHHNMGIKTFSTVCMDSGSTCISSDHSYIVPSVSLESEETFQNLNPYLSQGPEMHTTDTTSSISSASSPLNESLNEFSVLSNFSMISNNSEDSYSEKPISLKRSASPDDLFTNPSKRLCESPDANRYYEVRKKNNIASKNCRKTRKEKQKEMEIKVSDLEKEREDLNTKINYLNTMIAVYKKHIEAILKPRHNNLQL